MGMRIGTRANMIKGVFRTEIPLFCDVINILVGAHLDLSENSSRDVTGVTELAPTIPGFLRNSPQNTA
jgi:hypothetical protein